MSHYAYPPTSEDGERIAEMLGLYRTTIADKSAIYISTPMTSGLLYMNMAAKNHHLEDRGLTQECRHNLYTKNCQHARSVAAMTRLHYPTAIVIDPTFMEVNGWGQDDYLTFWRKVIIDYAYIVKFVRDWYYSNGCAYEFLVSALTNKVMIDEAENEISVYAGKELIQKAYDKQKEDGFDNEFLKNVIVSLAKYLSSEDGA